MFTHAQAHAHALRALLLAAALLASLGCESDYRKTAGDPAAQAQIKQARIAAADAAIQAFKTRDPSLTKFFSNAHGYAVFPEIAKGGAGIGGAHGEGVVYQQGKVIGLAEVSQGTIGFQLGGQIYSQVIFFQNAATLDRFKRSEMELSAQATAVAAKEGASANVDYTGGVAIFTLPQKGLMGEASAGGQKFSFTPVK